MTREGGGEVEGLGVREREGDGERSEGVRGEHGERGAELYRGRDGRGYGRHGGAR